MENWTRLIATHTYLCKNEAYLKTRKKQLHILGFTEMSYMSNRGQTSFSYTQGFMQKLGIVAISQETGIHACLCKNQQYSKIRHKRFIVTHTSLCNNQVHMYVGLPMTMCAYSRPM